MPCSSCFSFNLDDTTLSERAATIQICQFTMRSGARTPFYFLCRELILLFWQASHVYAHGLALLATISCQSIKLSKVEAKYRDTQLYSDHIHWHCGMSGQPFVKRWQLSRVRRIAWSEVFISHSSWNFCPCSESSVDVTISRTLYTNLQADQWKTLSISCLAQWLFMNMQVCASLFMHAKYEWYKLYS